MGSDCRNFARFNIDDLGDEIRMNQLIEILHQPENLFVEIF